MKRFMLDSLLEGTPDSIVFKDKDGRYAEVSQKKADNWGRTRSEMRGLTDFDLMDTEEAQQSREYSLQVIETKEAITDIRKQVVRKGELVWYSLSEQPWFNVDGELIGTISTSRDITYTVLQEQRALSMSQQIIDMVKIVSHDLNGPIVSISSSVKLIMRGYYGEISPGTKVAISDVHSRLLKQRGAVLDYLYKFMNLTEGQEVEKEELDLRTDVIDEVLEELGEMIKDNQSIIDDKLGLIPPDAIKLFSSKEILKIVYRNLMTNALKYGGTGSIISFGFEDRGDHFVLNVFNDGPEIPIDEAPYLFEPFVQGKNVLKGNGLGIGLYTIRNMVRNLGGEMWQKTTWSHHPNFLFSIMK